MGMAVLSWSKPCFNTYVTFTGGPMANTLSLASKRPLSLAGMQWLQLFSGVV